MNRRRPAVGGGLAVALVVDALHLNGAVKITVDLAARWAVEGARLVVVKRLPPEAEMGLPAGVRRATLSGSGSVARLAAPAALLRLLRHVRRSDAVVVGSEIGVGLILGYAAARIARRPLIIAVHADLDEALAEWMPPRWHRALRAIHRRADGVVCVEEALVDAVVANGLDRARVSVVTNGVDVDAVRRAAQHPDPLPSVPRPRVVTTGRLAAQKGLDLLIRAHASVVRELPHVLVLVNDGPEFAALQALAFDLRVQDSVVFAGPMPPHPLVAGADVFCLPSRHEGLPLSLLEAMALGVPCIAADCSAGVRSALDGGAAGELVPVGDVPALAAALRRHLTDPEPLRERARHGLQHLARFDVEAMTAGWAAAVRAVDTRSG